MVKYRYPDAIHNFTVEADSDVEAITKFRAAEAVGGVGFGKFTSQGDYDAQMQYAKVNPRSRSNPQGTPILLPTNAGPFLPDMFPYGIGGRPQALENPRPSKSKARKNRYVHVK
jgi:hypothetical protein